MSITNKLMKRLSLYLFLIFFTLQTPSWADDISDFQIEGMSVEDSLLDYMSKNEINMNDLKFYPNDSKYYEIEYAGKSDIFESVAIHIKRYDKKYEIYYYSRINLKTILKK